MSVIEQVLKEMKDREFNEKVFKRLFLVACQKYKNPCSNCCVLCESLEECQLRWQKNEFFCRKENVARWCSFADGVRKQGRE